MHRRLPRVQTLFVPLITLFGIHTLTANATGYYNFGMQWRGAMNPQRLGAENAFGSGFTSGLGASSINGNGDGMVYMPYGVVVGPGGDIYVVDSGNSRINKYNSSGAFLGWIGGISKTPTGGAAGCSSAAAGSATPGWCTGGAPAAGVGDGMMSAPQGLAFDSSGNLYVTDTGHDRIVKFNSSGVFQGWIGKINVSPTGGAAGCNGAASGTFTPGWCKGGFPGGGFGNGMMSSPSGIKVDSSGNIYVADFFNYRINKYNSAGAFQGWIGKIATSPTGGAAGCSGAAVGTFTPGWCKGGEATSGSGDGMMNKPFGIALDLSGNMYVSDINNGRIDKYNSAGAFQGWIGQVANSPTGGAAGCNGAAAGTLTPGWCTGGTSSPGTGDGMLKSPYGVAVDSSGNIFVTESINSRVSQYNSSGVFQGWIGAIATSPTGGATGCNGAAVGTLTPGWCTGGTSASGSSDGMMDMPTSVDVDSSGNVYVSDYTNHRISKYSSTGAFIGALQTTRAFSPWHRSTSLVSAAGSGDGMLNYPEGMSLDSSGNLFVADDNHRISKYNSSGVFQGWIGKIATSPTGGAAGCNGAAVGTFTPGWCKGGTATSGAGDGMLNIPKAVAVDALGNIYASDNQNARINKYDSSGAFVGWIGLIATSPTGGAAGCNGAAVGTFTPGWCTGGTSVAGGGDGALYDPYKMALDSSGNIYVADRNAQRLLKYDSSGAFQGWIGKISTSPTGGAAGCNGAAVGTFTPGWCKGGDAWLGSGDGMMYSPKGVAVDLSGNIYVTDSGNHRINKYNSLGAFQGWIGKITTSPTGGASGCSGAAVGTLTPGWCKGGQSTSGTGDGMMYYPEAIVVDSAGSLYVSDANHRISKYNSLGAFQGWVGMTATSTTGGATGCKGLAAYTATPGWCKGGTAGAGVRDGMMNTPTGLALDKSGNLYVADRNNNRVLRFSLQGR